MKIIFLFLVSILNINNLLFSNTFIYCCDDMTKEVVFFNANYDSLNTKRFINTELRMSIIKPINETSKQDFSLWGFATGISRNIRNGSNMRLFTGIHFFYIPGRADYYSRYFGSTIINNKPVYEAIAYTDVRYKLFAFQLPLVFKINLHNNFKTSLDIGSGFNFIFIRANGRRRDAQFPVYLSHFDRNIKMYINPVFISISIGFSHMINSHYTLSMQAQSGFPYIINSGRLNGENIRIEPNTRASFLSFGVSRMIK
jgi:hypothetical protein